MRMRNYKNVYRNLSLRVKLMINYIGTVVLIIAILIFLNTRTLLFEIEGLLDRNTSQLLQQTKNSVEYYIRDLENMVYYLSKDKNVKNYYEENDLVLRSIDKSNIRQQLEVYVSSHNQIDGLLIAFEDNTIISNNMVTVSDDPLVLDEWYQKAIKKPDDLLIFNKPIQRNVKNIYDYYSSDNLVTIVKAISLQDDEMPIGVVLIDLNIKGIEDSILTGDKLENEFFYMVDNQLDVVFAPVNKIIYRINDDNINIGDNSTFEQTINNIPFKILYEYSPYLNCYFVGVFSLGNTYSIIQSLLNNVFVYAFFLILLGIAITTILTNTITKPLRKLQSLMKKVEEGNLDMQFDVKSGDEIGQLGKGFNSMTFSINKLIQMVEKEQQMKKEAELKAFQAQIKPHFLYNTLDTINWMAQEYEADDISEIVCSLTTLFRLSLSKGRNIISLRDEIEQVESYLKIQMVRYKDKFTYEIKCEDELYDYQVVKLILQPLVENSIYHGIRGNTRFGYILIEGSKEKDGVYLRVIDNGMGMSRKLMDQINYGLVHREYNNGNMGIGINNINERIKLNYGSDYGLSIKESSDEGTVFEIRLPLE